MRHEEVEAMAAPRKDVSHVSQSTISSGLFQQEVERLKLLELLLL